jgi:hypothetical protein
MTRLILAAAAALALAGCASEAATVAGDQATAMKFLDTGLLDASSGLKVAEAALTAYEATPNPNAAVVAEAQKLDGEARAALAQYGPEANTAFAAAGKLATYVLTSAPGNGVTPTTVPTS